MKRAKGNSLLEYAVPLTIFVLTGTFVTVMADIPGRLSDYFSGTINGSRSGTEVTVKRYGSLLPGTVSQGTVITAAGVLNNVRGTRDVSITLPNGQSFVLENYPVNLQETIETAGANGTTEILLANLSDFIDELVAAGELTPAEAMSLRDLANKGHEIAAQEKFLEDLMNDQPASITDFYNQTVQYGGYTVPAGSLFYQIGIDGLYDASHPMDLSNLPYLGSQYGNEYLGNTVTCPSKIEEFVNLYHQAHAKGALNKPVAEQVVTQLVSQVIALGDHFENTTDKINRGTATDYLSGLATIDSDSHVNAYGICITGGDTDSGIQCQ